MSSVSFWTRADGLVVLHFAISTSATGSFTRVNTLQLVASLVAGAVIVGGTLSVAPADTERHREISAKNEGSVQCKKIVQGENNPV